MKQFKNYIPTKNKAPLVPFKNKSKDELLSYDEVKGLPDYAGIIEDGYILVDVDDEVQASIILSITKELKLHTLIYKTTRGLHLYFKVNKNCLTNKTNTFTAVGLKVDMKLGSRNSYACMKHQGIERELIYSTDEDIQELPLWLSPIKYSFPFLTMEKGDGRNQALFNYILTLQSNSYSKSEIKETLRIINSHVLEDKLDDKELEVILRDDSFKKQSFYGGSQGTTFLFDKFAKFLVSEHNIIKINGQLHIYSEGIYKSGDSDIENQMIRHIPTLSHSQRTEVLRYLNILIRRNTNPSAAKLLAFENGIYDLELDKFIDFSEDYIITNKIPWNYNPSSYSEVADKTMQKMACNDPEIRLLMEQAIGYTFYRRNEMRKSFMLTGGKANGKSTYLTMLQNVLGQENYTSLDLSQLGERFKTAELFGKLANIGDDIDDGFIKDTSIFKKIVSGDTVNVEKKGADPFDMNPYCKLLFSANTIPRMKDGTGAVTDRIIIVPFNATFSPYDDDFDPFIRYKLEEPVVMEYLINLGLAGLKKLLIDNKFVTSKKIQDKMEEYELENNPIKLFFKETDISDIENKSTASVYQNYQGFCTVNSLQPISRINFTKKVNEELGLISKQQRLDGKRMQVFINE